MPPRRTHTPKYRLHRPSGRAVVTVRGPDGKKHDVYLGVYDGPESLAEYRRVLAELAVGRSPERDRDKPPPSVTVAELLVAYLRHARETYRTPAGKPTPTFHALARTLRKLRERDAHLPAAEYGPRDLKALRDMWVAGGLSRKGVNGRAQAVKKVFRWGVAEDLVPPAVSQKLDAVEGLLAGRTSAPDGDPVRPADPAHVEAVLPHLPPAVAAIVKLQRMTGARCGELVVLRPRDIDRADPEAWVYTPQSHKTAWKGKGRVVLLGRRCQEVLAPYLLKAGGPDEYVFSPAREEGERNAARSAARKTKLYPSHARHNAARRAKARRPRRNRYDTQTVRQAVARACRKAGVPVFTPHQLRHLAGTEVRAELGAEVARAVLGHSLASMTERYSREVDRGLARQAAARFA